MGTDKRIDWIDIAKGIGILLVIIGHSFRDEMIEESVICSFIYNFIYKFHMPLFFTLSGFLLGKSLKKDYSTKQMLLKKVRTLLIPFAAYGILIYVVFRIMYELPVVGDVLNGSSYGLVSFVNYCVLSLQSTNPYAFHLWYLFVLFILETLIILFHRFVNINKRFKLMLLWIVAICLFVAAMVFDIKMKTLNAICKRLLFVVFGLTLSDYKPDYVHRKESIVLIGLASGAVLIMDCFVNVDTGLWSMIVYALVVMVARILFVYVIICYCKCIKDSRTLMYLGKNSFVIYLLHQPFCAVVGIILFTKINVNWVVTSFICCCLSIVIPIAVKTILYKNRVCKNIAQYVFGI